LTNKWRIPEDERDFFVAFMNGLFIVTDVVLLLLAVTRDDLDLILRYVL
jgi:hypothetical protein